MMETGSHFDADAREHGPNGAAPGAAAVDPNAYREPGPAPGVTNDDAGEGARPVPHGMVAALLARLGSAGIADPDKVKEFEAGYRSELEELFGWLDLSDALAEYGVTLGDGAPMPPWMRIAGAAGGAGVLLLMRRPELVGRMSAAMRGASRREAERDGDDHAGAAADRGGGPADPVEEGERDG